MQPTFPLEASLTRKTSQKPIISHSPGTQGADSFWAEHQGQTNGLWEPLCRGPRLIPGNGLPVPCARRQLPARKRSWALSPCAPACRCSCLEFHGWLWRWLAPAANWSGPIPCSSEQLNNQKRTYQVKPLRKQVMLGKGHGLWRSRGFGLNSSSTTD